jgi:hypothetical protein
LAEAESRRAVVVAKVAVEEADTEARTRLQDKVKGLKKAELDATLITKANAEAEQSVIVAEGQKKATVVTAEAAKTKLIIEADGAAAAREKKAEAERKALELEGRGEAAKTLAAGNAAAEIKQKTGEAEAAAKKANLVAEADGEKAKAEGTRARLVAEADGEKAKASAREALLKAEAEGVRAQGLARATGIEAELLAQATGVQKMLESFAGLTPDQMEMLRVKWIIEALPSAIASLGEAGEKIMGKVAEPIAAALGSIDNVTVYDSGSSGANGATGLERYAKIAPQALFTAFQSLKETGMLPIVMGALSKAGVDVSSLVGGMSSTTTEEKDK